MRDDAIGFALKAASGAAETPDVAAWWPRFREMRGVWRNPMDCAIAAGFASDRIGWAFASGYQSALQALFPGVPDDRLAALCVTEEDGNSPKAIKTSLADGRLNGSKKWTTLGPDGALFFVAARDAAAGGTRATIRIARVASGTAGVSLEEMPPTRFVPEVPHARLKFENVSVDASQLLPGDGYELYVKPFRTVEDIHVNAAILAYAVREARRLGWPGAWLERAAAALFSLRDLAAQDATSPVTHVALAGALAATSALFLEAGSLWQREAASPQAQRWERDKELLRVAGAARELRTQRAWEKLAPTR